MKSSLCHSDLDRRRARWFDSAVVFCQRVFSFGSKLRSSCGTFAAIDWWKIIPRQHCLPFRLRARVVPVMPGESKLIGRDLFEDARYRWGFAISNTCQIPDISCGYFFCSIVQRQYAPFWTWMFEDVTNKLAITYLMTRNFLGRWAVEWCRR